MKILLMMPVVQSLNPVIFAWFNRVAGLRILVLRQQLTVYKRRSKKPGAMKPGSAVLAVAVKDLDWTSESSGEGREEGILSIRIR